MNHPLIPRKALFGNPHRANVKVSPDGRYISFMAADSNVMNVWVAPSNDLAAARVVTRDRSTGVSQYFWAHTNRHVLFLQDNNGDEEYHLFVVDLETGFIKDLTPFDQIAAQVNHVSHRHPAEVLVGINDRDEHWFHDIYRINIETGERELIEKNDQFIGFIADDNLQLRFSLTLSQQSDVLVFQHSQKDGESCWEPFLTIPSAEAMTTSPIGLNGDGTSLFMLDSRGRDTAALKSVELDSGDEKLLFATDVADISGILSHPVEKTIQTACYTYDRVKFAILDNSVAGDFEYLNTVCDGEIEIQSQTIDQSNWIVSFATDNGPVRYYLYDRSGSKAEFLFSSRPELENLTLARMQPEIISSRDGLQLVSYLTLPISKSNSAGRPSSPLPMVLLVHGGPWWRDYWGFDPLHQLLANRGYAVLSVNFRGSTGFGKSFINAANGEWAGKMHDDLIDAVNWAVAENIADADRIAIMGGSYGGYAALVGLTFTPETFACGIDIVGPSNLITLMENPPPYWMPIMPMMTNRVGDYTTAEGRKFLESRSPLFGVERISKPLLIGQGANDPRVKQSESDQIVAAMDKKDIPVTYVLYPEEGHGFDRPENDISFYAICEEFLATHLGGRFEPIGNDFDGAKLEVRSGGQNIPGLCEAIAT